MKARQIVLGAYILAGLTPGMAIFLYYLTGLAFLKGIGAVGLGVFVIMAIMYATADKSHFDHEIDKLQKEWDEEDGKDSTG